MEGKGVSDVYDGYDADEASSSVTKDCLTCSELSHSTRKLSVILGEFKENKIMEASPIRKAVESLETELQKAKALVASPRYASSPNKRIEEITENLGRSIGLVLFASHDVSMNGKEKLEALRREMMSAAPFSAASSDSKSDFLDDVVTEEYDNIVEEIIEEEKDFSCSSVEDVVLYLKCGNDEQLKVALFGLNTLISDGTTSGEWIDTEGVIPILFSRLSSTNSVNRLSIIKNLRSIVAQNDEIKGKMAEVDYLSALVKSLARDEDERREAVGLLSTLSDVSAVRRRIGRIQGCIVMLVAIFNGEDQTASDDAGKLLAALSSNTQNALHMAEAGYFKPLIKYLTEGSDMSKILMATAISRMELRDETRASIGEDGAIPPLVKMFKEGKLEAKLSSLSALQNLSTLKENTKRLINSGIVPSLLQLLFSVTSVLMTLREPASAILARIAKSDDMLVNHDIALQMFSLLNLSSPIIQIHLLEALNSIISHPRASKVRRKMKENGSIQLLLPFLTESNPEIRIGAFSFIYTLSKELSDELMDQLGETHVLTIVNTLSSSTSDNEKAIAAGILCNIPVTDKKATDILKKANLLPVLVSIMSSKQANSTNSTTPLSSELIENIAGVLIRFTITTNVKLQLYAGENRVIPVLVKILSDGPIIAKCRAATSLAQLSRNCLNLRKSKKSTWLCVHPSKEAFCEVHNGYCFVKTTFCLVKSGAVSPLIKILEGDQREADEAVLEALSTLLQDEIWENGCGFLEKVAGIEAIIKVMEFGSVKTREKAVWILERVFRVEDYRVKYGAMAQVVLIDLAQNGEAQLKPTVAKLLAQLELLQFQSDYF
ncbi:putative armadillo-like helical protein [Helianthus annuus]|uniref:Armadillo-like helical protein n=1 Tax=Helianthus annuus TaxID=4232 RepID=A0A251S2Q5_HELAN|nr:U-box domain-containing protein 44 [Helianthus annuus]XP_022018357.1 U-box domain-containing protein 44 [Helianthus annuus]KAF5761729.1 putative armadillo-like helical protein [Helianthus annuus]